MSHPLFRKKTISAILADAQTGLSDATHSASGLNKVLRTKDLVAMGIAAIVGAGIFSTIGNASFQGGPGVSLLFVLTAICCGFSALCYAEFKVETGWVNMTRMVGQHNQNGGSTCSVFYKKGF